MAYKQSEMTVIAYANGWTAWHYTSKSETITDIAGNNYFAVMYGLMNRGDIIYMNAIDGVAELAVVKIGENCVNVKILSQIKY